MNVTLRTAVVAPAYNEQGKIGRVVNKVPRDIISAIVVVDDCSTDATSAEAAAAGAVVIRHERNRGVGAAIRSGIDYALANGFDAVAILSGDDQHDPNDLYGMLALLEQGYDFVQGSRRFAGGLDAPNIGWFRRMSTWGYTIVFRLVSGFPCTDATNGGRAFRLRIFDDRRINLWQDWLDTYELETYLLFKAIKTHVRIVEAPVKVIYHDRGTTKMKPFRDWWRIMKPLVYLSLGLRK
ncbi:MAG: glycosyltransferase family 2 protein [Chloroflexi bacterium]|nr:glycosyltransferase family 2 protein [Chloroflexota bacterium]